MEAAVIMAIALHPCMTVSQKQISVAVQHEELRLDFKFDDRGRFIALDEFSGSNDLKILARAIAYLWSIDSSTLIGMYGFSTISIGAYRLSFQPTASDAKPRTVICSADDGETGRMDIEAFLKLVTRCAIAFARAAAGYHWEGWELAQRNSADFLLNVAARRNKGLMREVMWASGGSYQSIDDLSLATARDRERLFDSIERRSLVSLLQAVPAPAAVSCMWNLPPATALSFAESVEDTPFPTPRELKRALKIYHATATLLGLKAQKNGN